MKITKEQLKQIIKEELQELMSKRGREEVLPRPGQDWTKHEDEASAEAVKLMHQQKPDGPIGINTLQTALNSGDPQLMKDTIDAAQAYLNKIRTRYGGMSGGANVELPWGGRSSREDYLRRLIGFLSGVARGGDPAKLKSSSFKFN